MLPFFQIPLFFILSHSYKNLARLYPDPTNPAAIMAYEQLQTEGMLWFSNLVVPDPIGALPVLACVLNLMNIQIHVNERKRKGIKDSLFVKIVTNGGRLVSFALIPLGMKFPADMTLYWTLSAAWGLGQNIALQNQKVKDFFGLKELSPAKPKVSEDKK